MLLATALEAAATLDELQRGFLQPPPDSRIMMRWWWFGPAVTKDGIERELRTMKAGGIGGVEVQPVYPLETDDPAKGFRNLPYLSPEFLDLVRYTADKARELGLRMDLTLGSGWPYGGPHIPVTQAAGRLRIDKVKPSSRRIPVPDLAHGESLIAAFDAQTNAELTDGIRDGVLRVAESRPIPGEVWFFIASRSGMMVKRPGVGAEGFVLDHYDRDALTAHLRKVGDPLMRALGSSKPYAVFCDSLEVFGSDWTGDFLDQFRKRRGYDLKPHLVALAGGSDDRTRAVRYDWGRTLTELYEERFMTPLSQWAKANGTQLRIQNYGMPPATIASAAPADLPEGEGPQWKVVRASRYASSASHIYGRTVTSSETWTWLHSPAFRATPLDVKAEADLHFLQGINQLIGHGWPYNPPDSIYPGTRFYAAGVFNDRNPWWIVMPDLSLYLQRVSYLLRQGRPANDVALYLPNADAWASFRPGQVHLIETLRERVGPKIMPAILEGGYNLDFFDDGSLATRGRVEGNRLFLGENGYRVVVLPGVETMPVETIPRLEQFMRAGGIVIATRSIPKTAPGLMASAAESGYVQRAAASMTLVPSDSDLTPALRAALRPDVGIPHHPEAIGFVHRTTPEGEIYFVANTSNQRWSGKLTFRTTASLQPQQWNAVTGETSGFDGRIDLAPYESRVFVFGAKRITPSQSASVNQIADLSGGWTLSFRENGQRLKVDSLRSWTDSADTRFYSGSATYERDFTIPAAGRYEIDFGEGTALTPADLRNGMRAWLDPPIREAAVIYVNGRRAGSLWCPPYRLDVSEYVKAGANHLKVVVANLALNAMAGRPLPSYRLLNLRYGVRFEPQDMDKVQPAPSGLVGAVRLMEVRVSR